MVTRNVNREIQKKRKLNIIIKKKPTTAAGIPLNHWSDMPAPHLQ